MVCLDAFTNRAKAVNPLVPVTEDEKALYKMGEGWCIYTLRRCVFIMMIFVKLSIQEQKTGSWAAIFGELAANIRGGSAAS